MNMSPKCGRRGRQIDPEVVRSAENVAMSRPNPLASSTVSLLAPPGDERPRGRPADPQKFRVRVADSRIDGQGAFAAEPIPARRKIGEIRGESISVREARRRAKGQLRIMIVEVSERRAIDASASSDPLRYTNHSCVPNASLRIRQGRVELYAMRDIAGGEEICANYGESHHEGRLRCRCGTPGCAGRL
jgi:hypothetical protein